MAPLTEKRVNTGIKAGGSLRHVDVDLQANAIVFQDGIVSKNGGGTGFARAGTDAASEVFLGIAHHNANNTGGADGAVDVKLQLIQVSEWDSQNLVQQDIWLDAFISDDQTVARAADAVNNVRCGKFVKIISATRALVAIHTASLSV